MKLLRRNEIDTTVWDQRIEDSKIENIFCYSWYLDAVANNWMAVVSEGYRTIVPIPYTEKLGVKQFYQAPFSREYDIFGDEFDWVDVATFLKDEFRGMDFRNGEKGLFKEFEERIHQYIPLDENYAQGFKTNAKRIIKKSKERFQINPTDQLDLIIDLFNRTAAHKIDSISESDLDRLEILMSNALDRGFGQLFSVRENGQDVAAAFCLLDKKRVTYLKGAAEDVAKKDGAMYFAMNFAFERYHQAYDTFDFGGSDIENVANFYKKFGAVDRTYYNYRIDQLPIWFKTLKKLKS